MVHNTVSIMLESWQGKLSKVKLLVKYFKVTGANAKLPTCLKSFVQTRWNSVYYMLKTVIKMWDDIVQALAERDELERLYGINKQELELLCEFLELFQECTSEIEASRTPTLHLVLPWYHELQQHLQPNYLDVEFIGQMKEAGRKYLENNVGKKIHLYHRMATFCHPALKNLPMLDADQRSKTYLETKGFLIKYDGAVNNRRRVEPIEELPKNRVSKAMARFIQNTTTESGETGHAEVERYITKESISIPNILAWWHENKDVFPRMYRLACFLFAIPASSAAVERVFSTAGHCVKDRPNLKGKFNIILYIILNKNIHCHVKLFNYVHLFLFSSMQLGSLLDDLLLLNSNYDLYMAALDVTVLAEKETTDSNETIDAIVVVDAQNIPCPFCF